ncbi:hypothetical protein NO995_02455 [Aestuariibaculum sp. M13]|uniref:hypothetical protein n=1 Tax=Aestuariibaculum sp. M13 TaxID=2967132 RepID=UPI002159E5FF|nr:hypothetical protein [Aestuariibaculum sp. M13]MCR8666526.1 hypothetical protein [Aestuariibaculum sp. M13]
MLKKLLSVVLIFIGISLLISLIPKIPLIISAFSKAMINQQGGDWGSFAGLLTIYVPIGILDYFLLKFGFKLFRND